MPDEYNRFSVRRPPKTVPNGLSPLPPRQPEAKSFAQATLKDTAHWEGESPSLSVPLTMFALSLFPVSFHTHSSLKGENE